MQYKLYVFEDFGQEYLVEVSESGKASLKLRENGRWQAPIYPKRVEEHEYSH